MSAVLPIVVATWLMAPTEPTAPPLADELQLIWEAPPECPETAVVIERVQGLLGRPLRGTEHTPVRVEARVAAEAGQLQLSLRTETTEGHSERQMAGQTCEVLVDAAALVIAIALDPSLALGEPEPEPAPEVVPDDPEPLPRCIPTEITAPVLEPEVDDARPRVAGTVRAAATGSLGPLPSAAPGFEVAAGFVQRHARVELGFDYFFPRRVAVAEGEDRGGEIGLWTVAARGCFVPAVSILELPVCAGLQAGPMRGEGYGLSTPTSTRLPWLAVEAGGALVVRGLPLVDLWFGADLVVPLTRPGFVIDDVGLVHRGGVIGGEASAGIEMRFGPGRELERRSRAN